MKRAYISLLLEKKYYKWSKLKVTGEQWGWKEEIKYVSIHLGYWYLYTGGFMQIAEFRVILLPALALIFTKLPEFLLENVQPFFILCLQPGSQPLLGATVLPRAQSAHGITQLKHVWVPFLCSQDFQCPICCTSCPFNPWWWCPCERDRYRQKSPLWFWRTFQPSIPLSLTNEGKIFLFLPMEEDSLVGITSS